MKKSTITAAWLGGLVAMIAGLLVVGLGVGLMLANGGTWQNDVNGNATQFVPRQDGYFWTTVGIIVMGGVVMAAGALVQLAAWIGALVNTYHLTDKVWFVVLLVLGLVGWGFVAMIAYLVAGPDGEQKPAIQPMAQAPRPPAIAPST